MKRIQRLACKRTLLRKIHERKGAAREEAVAVSACSMTISILAEKEKDLEKNVQDIEFVRGAVCKQCGLVPFPACFFVVMNAEPWLKSC